MAEDNLIKNRSVHEEALVFFDIVTAQISTVKLLTDFIYMAGYDVGDMEKPKAQGETTMDKLVEATKSTRAVYERVREEWPEDWISKDGAKSLFNMLKQVFDEYKKCKAVFELAGQENDLDIDWTALTLHVMQQVFLRGLAIWFPPGLQVCRLLNWVSVGNENQNGTEEPEKKAGQIIRYPYRGISFNSQGVEDFLRNPGKALKEHYFKDNSIAAAAAENGQPDDELLVKLRDLFKSLGLNAVYGYKPSDSLSVPAAKEAELSQTMSTWFSPSDHEKVAFSFYRDGNRIIVTPILSTNRLELEIGKWHWTFDLGAGGAAFSIGRDGIDFPGSGAVHIEVHGTPGKKDTPEEDKEPAYTIGAKDGTRLVLGKIDFHALLDLNGGVKKADVKLSITKSGFHLVPGDGDSFLQKILPEKGISIPFDLTLGYSNQRGFYIDGGAGGEILIPVNKSFGKFSLPALQLGIRKLSNTDDWMLYASITGKTEMGPVTAVLDKVGLSLMLNKPTDGAGNIGIFDAALDFKHPSGIGIVINAKGLTGGGFLELDRDKGQYTGMLQLKFRDKINIVAFGILQTKPSFSFLIIVSAEFPAIQLGLGFSLTGVGGLAGIHRRIELQKVLDGITKNDIDDILFPKDPISNAHALIGKINSFFPPAENQFTFGLMAQLAWGPKRIVTIELGLIMEFPEPVRVVILGVLRTEITKKIGGKEIKALKLQVNFVAAIDFDKQFIRLDAALVDSILLNMKLEGDMALRVKYGANPDFAITIGGFHPRFQPPALDLPAKMRRLQIILKSGNPSITVQCYLAVTSNTIQFGVAGLFVFKKWGVGIRGELSFDALFQLSPFHFETDVHFLLAASWKGHDFAAIEVNGTFSGPSPWRIKGSLRLKVWIFSKTISIDESWGDKDAAQIEGVRILPLLAEDLKNSYNWERSTGSTRLSVALKKRVKSDTVLTMHPTELLTVRQSTVPLGYSIDRFAGRRPQGANTFSITLLKNGQTGIPATRIVSNHFATAQFFEISDEEKLSAPSYQLFNSGASFDGLDAVVCDAAFRIREVEYEPRIVDTLPAPASSKARYRENGLRFARGVMNNATANSPYAPVAARKNVPVPGTEKYMIVDEDTLKAIDVPAAGNEVEAWQMLRGMKEHDIFDKLHLTVLPVSECIWS